jgi:hypothetical protein
MDRTCSTNGEVGSIFVIVGKARKKETTWKTKTLASA